MKGRLRLIAFTFLCACLAYAQEGTKPDSEELARLKEEVALAEQRAKLAKAEKETRDARTPDVKPLEGKTTIDDKVKIESEMLGYQAARTIAAKIAEEVKPKLGDKSSVILHDAALYDTMRLYENFEIQLLFLERAYTSASQPQPKFTAFSGGILGASGLVRSAIDLISLFRQDTEFKGREFDVKDSALAAMVARELLDKKIVKSVLYPKLMMLDFTKLSKEEMEKNVVYIRLAGLANQRDDGNLIISRWSELDTAMKKCDERLKELRTQKATPEEIRDDPSLSFWRGRYDELKKTLAGEYAKVEAYRAANALYDSFLGTITKVDEKTGVSALNVVLQAERMLQKLKQPNVYSLKVERASSGGSYEVRRTLWDSLIRRPTMRYSGGAVISYVLMDYTSQVKQANALYYMTGFTRFKAKAPNPGGNNFESKSGEANGK